MSTVFSKYRFYSASLIALASSGSATARPVPASGGAGVKIHKPLEIISSESRYNSLGLASIAPPPPPDVEAVEWSSLYFGSIVPPQSGSALIALSPEGARTCPENAICLTNDHHAARFGVTGEDNRFFAVSLPSGISVSNGSDMMDIENLTSSLTTGFLRNGYSEFCIGGDLIVEAGQSTGDYTGTYQVTVEYQ